MTTSDPKAETGVSVLTESGEIVLRRIAAKFDRLSSATPSAREPALTIAVGRTHLKAPEAKAGIDDSIAKGHELPWLEQNQHGSTGDYDGQKREHVGRLEPGRRLHTPKKVAAGLLLETAQNESRLLHPAQLPSKVGPNGYSWVDEYQHRRNHQDRDHRAEHADRRKLRQTFGSHRNASREETGRFLKRLGSTTRRRFHSSQVTSSGSAVHRDSVEGSTIATGQLPVGLFHGFVHGPTLPAKALRLSGGKAVLHKPQSDQYDGHHADQGYDEHGVDLTRRTKLIDWVVKGSRQAKFRNGTRRIVFDRDSRRTVGNNGRAKR